MLLLECAAALCEDASARGKLTEQMAGVRGVLVQMMVPPALRSGDPANALLALERTFENQVAELATHCHVTEPERLTVFQFLHRVEYFEQLTRQRGKAVQ